MRYPNWDTFLEQFWKNEQAQRAKIDIATQFFMEEEVNLKSENSLKEALQKVDSNIELWKQLTYVILKNIRQVTAILTPKTIEQYTWWIPCLERSRDLHDELYINQQLYKTLFIEAKLRLQELKKIQDKLIPQQEKCIETLVQISIHRAEYQEIIEQMNKIRIINGTLKEQLESWDLE